jgi:hypothetical protein
LLLGVFVAACGPEPLAGVGDHASRWINVSPPSTQALAPTTVAPSLLGPVSEVTWFNQDLEEVEGNYPGEVIAAVFRRGGGSDRFVQATAHEIASALPGVRFPALIPVSVRFITSQLVYQPGAPRLAEDFAAAFGLWTVEPYTRSRAAAQEGTLLVAEDPDEAAAVAAGAGDLTCARFADTSRCSQVYLGAAPAWRLSNELGNTLIWYQSPFRYELFLRSDLGPEILTQMAEAAVSLSQLS